MSYNSIGTKLTYLMLGMGIGAAVALLFAPQSGEKTRKRSLKKHKRGRILWPPQDGNSASRRKISWIKARIW